MIQVGQMNSFIVVRKTDIGYMLMNKEEEILLHEKQCLGKELEVNTTIECFVQYDSKGRLTATLEVPTVTISKPGFAKVQEVNDHLGVFMGIGTFKDVLLSKDDLPSHEYWPEVGDYLFIKMFLNKGHLNAKIASKNDILEFGNPNPHYEAKSKIEGYLLRVSDKAIHGITEEMCHVYVPIKQSRGAHHIGEKVLFTVMSCQDGEIVASLNKVVTELMTDDAEVILQYLERKKGVMPFTAKTDSEEIEKVFKMSRKAFKRALGHLYKEGKVICDDYQTKLVK